MSRETAIETIIDYSIDYDHLTDSYYNKDNDLVIKVCLIKNKPKDVAKEIWKELNNDKELINLLNEFENIVKIIIYDPTYRSTAVLYEM